MAKEIFLYNELDSWVAEYFNREVVATTDKEINVNINGPGGVVRGGIAMLTKLNSYKEKGGKVNMFVDSNAGSFYAIMLIFADYSEASDLSTIDFHKAAYPENYKPTEEEQKEVDQINSMFREKLELRLQNKGAEAKAFIDMLFEEGVRNEISLTGKEAKDLGIIDEVKTIDVRISALKKEYADLQMKSIKKETQKHQTQPQKEQSSNNYKSENKMDLAQFKAEHPAIYAQAFAEGESAGIEKEYQRTNTILAYKDAGLDECLKMIKDKDDLTQSKQAELQMKAMSNKKLGELEDEGKETGKAGSQGSSPEGDKAKMSESDKAEIEAYRSKKFIV